MSTTRMSGILSLRPTDITPEGFHLNSPMLQREAMPHGVNPTPAHDNPGGVASKTRRPISTPPSTFFRTCRKNLLKLSTCVRFFPTLAIIFVPAYPSFEKNCNFVSVNNVVRAINDKPDYTKTPFPNIC